MIFEKIWQALGAQINRIANFFWQADPIAQLQYEYDDMVDQLKQDFVRASPSPFKLSLNATLAVLRETLRTAANARRSNTPRKSAACKIHRLRQQESLYSSRKPQLVVTA